MITDPPIYLNWPFPSVCLDPQKPANRCKNVYMKRKQWSRHPTTSWSHQHHFTLFYLYLLCFYSPYQELQILVNHSLYPHLQDIPLHFGCPTVCFLLIFYYSCARKPIQSYEVIKQGPTSGVHQNGTTALTAWLWPQVSCTPITVFISSMQSMDNTSVCFCFLYIAHCECVLNFHTSEIFLSVSFLFSSNFRSIPTIPTARVLPAYRTTENSRKEYHPHSLLHAQTISQTYTLKNNKGKGRKGLEWSNLQGLLQATILATFKCLANCVKCLKLKNRLANMWTVS